LNVLAVLGIRSGRAGFTTLEVRGRRPGIAPVFAPLQSGVEARAALATVRSEAELLELAWRVETLG
jgi:hypothetical protein